MSFTLPGKIVEEYSERGIKTRGNRIGLVRFGDTARPIVLDLVPGAYVGDYVHVRAGFATDVVPEADALREYQVHGPQDLERELEEEEALPETTIRQKT
jgi:hydrogenase maturation factor